MTSEEIRGVARAKELTRISQKALDEVEAALVRGFTKEDHEARVRAKYYFEAYKSIGVLTKTDWMYLVLRVLKSTVTSPPAGSKYR
uniref:Uncharacterized protein n=1 Tax=Caudovirales sp. ctUL28 TaxID=2826778 RepID=A0A8S5MV25_9CAUD|nr:MAG TPA: hypothetical protein [Caudovirales sp. ctUL28]